MAVYMEEPKPSAGKRWYEDAVKQPDNFMSLFPPKPEELAAQVRQAIDGYTNEQELAFWRALKSSFKRP